MFPDAANTFLMQF